MVWFSCAQRRPIAANTGGRLAPNFGLVLHHAVANGSLWEFFNNPSSQVSAHFWVAKNGTIEQYVDTDVIAWHGKQLNSRYVGVETEGCATPPYAEPMTEAMVDALGRLYQEGANTYGWPNALAEADGQPGFGYHRMAVQTACPCDVRVNKRSEILDRAFGKPVTPTTEENGDMIASTSTGGGYWTATFDGAVSAFGDAQFKGNVYNKMTPGTRIVGIAGKGVDGYWMLGSDGGVFAFGSAQYEGRPDRV